MPSYSCAVALELIYEVEAEDEEAAKELVTKKVLNGQFRQAVGPAEITDVDVQEI